VLRRALLVSLLLTGAAATLFAFLGGASVMAAPTVAAGRVTTADLAIPDPDLALVTALARGPQVLGIPVGQGPQRVLAVPQDAPATLGPLQATQRHFDFTDPHGNAWVVQEYRAAWGYAYGTSVGPTTSDADAGPYNVVLLVDHTRVGEHVRLVAV